MYFITMNKYYEFLEKIIRDFRSSSYEMENKYDIKGFSVKMSELKKNPNRKLTQKSIADIEKALNIKIDDSDTDNITYTKVEEKPKPDNKIIERTYRVVGEIGAGVLEVDELFQDEYVTVTFDPSNNQLFRIKSEKYSMAPTVMPGDMIVIDLAAKPKPGDMVVIGWRENGKAHGALKILNTVRDDFLAFTSINPAEPLLIVPRKELIKMFKVKQVIKE